MKNHGLLLVLFTSIFLVACTNHEALLEHPQEGDIYIFQEADLFYPVMVDSVSGDMVRCVNSQFHFADAIPTPADLPKEDFDFSFYLFYERTELMRLYKSGSIAEIYREE